MKKNVYKGRRYVPKIMGIWNINQAYESLSIVTWRGASYTSKTDVPIGVSIDDEQYWVLTGNYNAQIEIYRQDLKNHIKQVQCVMNDYEKSKVDIYGNKFDFLYERLYSIDERISDISSKNIRSLGCVGDGITDNAKKFREIVDSLQDYDTLYIPEGIYRIDITDDYLIDLGMTGKPSLAYCLIDSKKNITITGSGTIYFNVKKATKKIFFMAIRNCNNFSIQGTNFTGDTVFGENITIDDRSVNGFMFEKCIGTRIVNNTFQNMLAVLSITNDVQSPSVIGGISENSIVSNNIFYNYGQITTFGGGTSRLIFSSNICVNPLQCGFKSSTNVQNSARADDTYQTEIINNIITWTKDYKFSIVGWDTSKRFSPVGIMLESHTNKIVIDGNLIDLSYIQEPIDKPIQVVAGIALMRGASTPELQNIMINVTNNTIVMHPNRREAITVAPSYNKLFIENNILNGQIGIGTTSTIYQMELLHIKGNTFYNDVAPVGLSFRSGNYKKTVVSNNTFHSKVKASAGYESYIEIDGFVGSIFQLLNNDMVNGDVLSYTTNKVNFDKVIIHGNVIRAVNIVASAQLKQLTYSNNVVISDKTSLSITGHSNLVVEFAGNTGETAGSMIVIDAGTVLFDATGLKSRSGVPMSFGTAFIEKGTIIGQGNPEGKINALFGVTYLNYSTTRDAIWIKNTVSGNTGWKQLFTTP